MFGNESYGSNKKNSKIKGAHIVYVENCMRTTETNMHLRTFRHRRSDRQTVVQDDSSISHLFRIEVFSVLCNPRCHKNKMFLPTFMTSEHPGSHVFLQTRTIFIHIPDII
ncbi:hypothetical protein DPMN_133557 [Dreissena polymorpha]|uniref:Uncharacterized protein n=1 Tax=Dreissena polymorpha TaxID=45954 RepID=A0A9D4FYK2_DREPO|nr:hypothetical protein DPMN_133557 [Dreissena polymorpha]